jgi:signal transduction histidine kinase
MENEVDIIVILFIGTGLMIFLASAIVFFIYIYQRKLIKKQIEFQRVENILKKQELENAYKVLQAKDIERQAIARELHDNVGSILTSVNIYLDTIRGEQDTSKVIQKLDRTREIAKQATDEVRKLSHRLDSVSLKHFGLETAVMDLVQIVEDNNTLKFNVSLALNDELDYEVSFNLYRIIQELVNNTLKYAQASKINLEIHTINDEYISFIFEDNGKGFDMSEGTKGMGLLNIQSRVEKMGGKLTTDSTHRGSSFIIEIPLQ